MSDASDASDMPSELFVRTLAGALVPLGLELNASQYKSLWAHYQAVMTANRSFNLTRITDPVEAAVRHYADSLSLLTLPEMDRGRPMELLDVGTGAGYPAVPLAVACPAWQVTAIDGTGKKARFVAETAARLGLGNLRAQQKRAVELGSMRRGAFDVVCLRAVAPLEKGLREVHRLIREGGCVVFYKSTGLKAEERVEGDRAARQFGLDAGQRHEVTMTGPNETLSRLLMVYRNRSGRGADSGRASRDSSPRSG